LYYVESISYMEPKLAQQPWGRLIYLLYLLLSNLRFTPFQKSQCWDIVCWFLGLMVTQDIRW